MQMCPFLVSAFFLVRLTPPRPKDACVASLAPPQQDNWSTGIPWLQWGVSSCRWAGARLQDVRRIRTFGFGEADFLRWELCEKELERAWEMRVSLCPVPGPPAQSEKGVAARLRIVVHCTHAYRADTEGSSLPIIELN